MRPAPEKLLVIACGALAREVIALKRRYNWHHMDMQCIDALLHNRPALIPDRIRAKIHENAGKYDRIFVAYADCGTGGGIDQVIEEENVERLPGAHCYQFFAGTERFTELSDVEPGTFYLTDFLTRNFERLVMRPLKLRRHPELRDAYFGNYRKLVYLSQASDASLISKAQQAAHTLGLEFVHEHSGYGGLRQGLNSFISGQGYDQENTRVLA